MEAFYGLSEKPTRRALAETVYQEHPVLLCAPQSELGSASPYRIMRLEAVAPACACLPDVKGTNLRNSAARVFGESVRICCVARGLDIWEAAPIGPSARTEREITQMAGLRMIDRWLNKALRLLLLILVLRVIVLVCIHLILANCIQISVVLIVILAASCAPHLLARDHIIDRWDAVIPGAGGKGDELLDDVEQRIDEIGAPDICTQRQLLAPGLWQCVLNRKRSFLIICNTANCRLRLYRMYINTEVYGAGLHVFWYLARHRSLWEKLMAVVVRVSNPDTMRQTPALLGRRTTSHESAMLDTFDEQDLKMYVANAHHCLLEAINELTEEHDLEMNVQSDGFLGVS